MANVRQRLEFKLHHGLILVDNFSEQEINPQTLADLDDIFVKTFEDLPNNWYYKLELKIFKFTDIEKIFGQAMFTIGGVDGLMTDYFQDDDATKMIISLFNDGHQALLEALTAINKEKEKLGFDKGENIKSTKSANPASQPANDFTPEQLGKMFDEL